jgi:hypothetical protein
MVVVGRSRVKIGRIFEMVTACIQIATICPQTLRKEFARLLPYWVVV